MGVFPVTMRSGSIGNARYSIPSGGLSRHRRHGVCGHSALFPPAPGARVRFPEICYVSVTVIGPASTVYPSLLK
jgi:hypothetical protein